MKRLLAVAVAVIVTLVANLVLLLGVPNQVQAQELKGQPVKIAAADGLQIAGLYYPPTGSGKAPAALLLHQNGGNKELWAKTIAALQKAGYGVLAVDQRGFGETKGSTDWKLAVTDVAAMMMWLRDQPNTDKDYVAIIGASIGSNLALVGCAADKACKVAVALSPGKNYFGVEPAEPLKDMRDKSILLLAAQHDGEAADGVRGLAALPRGDTNVMMRLYGDSSKHGNALADVDEVNQLIVMWLQLYNVPAKQ